MGLALHPRGLESLAIAAVVAAGWSEQHELHAPDGAAGDGFGYAVAVSSTRALVGASGHDANGSGSGAAYLFDLATGAPGPKLMPADAEAMDVFGVAVALRGELALVGAMDDADNGPQSGSAYLFDAATGRELLKLLPADGGPRERFGRAVALDGTTALIGAYRDDDAGLDAGSSYLFDTSDGAQLAELRAPQVSALDLFGFSVALRGELALVGAPGDDDGGREAGCAYLLDTSTGQVLTVLRAHDPSRSAYFGTSVALSQSHALVGAPYDDQVAPDAGAAYMFDVRTGVQVAKLTAPGGAAGANLGLAVALRGATALVGAPNEPQGDLRSGAAYLFEGAHPAARLVPSTGAMNGYFGGAVALSGGAALVGAFLEDELGFASGSAYAYRLE